MFFEDNARSCVINDTGTMMIGKKVTAVYLFNETPHEIVEVAKKSSILITEILTSTIKKDKQESHKFEWVFNEEQKIYFKKGSNNVMLRPF